MEHANPLYICYILYMHTLFFIFYLCGSDALIKMCHVETTFQFSYFSSYWSDQNKLKYKTTTATVFHLEEGISAGYWTALGAVETSAGQCLDRGAEGHYC